MDKNRIVSVSVALAVLLATGAVGGFAYAKERGGEGHDAQALANSKVSLSQAIAAAEQQSGGKAVGAEVDNENGKLSIAVEVASSQGVKTVLVDPQSGQVTGTKAAGDHDGEEND